MASSSRKPKSPLVVGGRVVDGAIHFDNRKLFDAALKAWQGRVTVTVAPEQQKRSLRAQAFLFGIVYRLGVEALRDAGYTTITAEQLHAIMKERHNAEVIIDPFTGAETRVGKTTTTLPVEDYGIFIERVMVDLAELCGISFPEPRKDEDWRERPAETHA